MLILTRKLDERIRIGDDIIITVTRIDADSVKLGFDAPRAVQIHREEVYGRRSEVRGQRSEVGVAGLLHKACNSPTLLLLYPFLIGLLLLAIGPRASGATVTGIIRDRTDTPIATNATFQAVVKQRTLIEGQVIYPGWEVTATSGTNGAYSINLVTGDYQVFYGNTGRDHFLIRVPSGAGTYDVTAIATNVQTAAFTTNPIFVEQTGDTMSGNLNWNTTADHLGLILKAMTTAQRDALTATNGAAIYNLTDLVFQFYQDDAWVNLGTGSGSGSVGAIKYDPDGGLIKFDSP